MPPERAKKLFLGLHEAVEHTVEEKEASPTPEHPATMLSEKEKKGMADDLPLESLFRI